MVVFLTRDGMSRLPGPVTCDCRLARTQGGWLFQRRFVTLDHDYELEGI
jgi:hypothetical protein